MSPTAVKVFMAPGGTSLTTVPTTVFVKQGPGIGCPLLMPQIAAQSGLRRKVATMRAMSNFSLRSS